MLRGEGRIREFRRSLLKLLHIHDLVRFCKQGVVAAYHNNTPQQYATTIDHNNTPQQYFNVYSPQLLFTDVH